MKIAVIGSNSFSGSSFVDHALGRGAEVIGISRSPEPHPVFLPYRWSGRDGGFRFHALDLNHDLDAIMALLAAERPGFVVNFAAQSMVAESWDNPTHWFRSNVVSTVGLHDRLRQCDFLDRYVHFSTPEVYGSTDGFVREDRRFNPTTPYAVSRAAADMSLATFFSAYGFPVVITRAANVYGPGQRLYRLIPRSILFIRLGRKLQLHGGGRSSRSFIHIDDVSDATWRVMTEGTPGETYHISTAGTVTVRALVERICAMTGVAFADAVEMADERLGKDSAYELDSGKIRQELGWSDRIDLDAGLHSCIEWIDANLETLARQDYDYVHKP
jgi:dTDP-glucose 4,6-dehydratase